MTTQRKPSFPSHNDDATKKTKDLPAKCISTEDIVINFSSDSESESINIENNRELVTPKIIKQLRRKRKINHSGNNTRLCMKCST